MAKKRILRDFRLDKIAAVDNPCQEGARVAIIKRKDDDMNEIEKLKKEHDEAIAKINGDWQTKLDALTKQVEKMQADLEVEKAKAKMTDEDKEFMEDEKDEEKKKKFLAMTPELRKAEIAKRKSGDETIVVGGATIRKSVVGEAAFGVLKAQQVLIEESKTALAKAEDERETAKIEKRVDEEFKHVVGKTADKAKVLKHMAKASKDVQDAFEAIMKSAESMIAKGFERFGHGDGSVDVRKGQAPFNEAVSKIMARDKISKSRAMEKAAIEHPDLYEAYQDAGTAGARQSA